jgi:hypothetical protein
MMIKKLYKKIRLYFINKKINKIKNRIRGIECNIKTLEDHIHDIPTLTFYESMDLLTTQLTIAKLELNSYNEDKKRIGG